GRLISACDELTSGLESPLAWFHPAVLASSEGKHEDAVAPGLDDRGTPLRAFSATLEEFVVAPPTAPAGISHSRSCRASTGSRPARVQYVVERYGRGIAEYVEDCDLVVKASCGSRTRARLLPGALPADSRRRRRPAGYRLQAAARSRNVIAGWYT